MAPEKTTDDETTCGLPEEMLCFSVYAASHAFNHLYRKALADLGLTYPQYLVMTLLWQASRLGVSFGNAANGARPCALPVPALRSLHGSGHRRRRLYLWHFLTLAERGS